VLAFCKMKEAVLFVRCDEALKAKLQAAARENGRSLTQEILYRLRQSFEGWQKL